MLTYGAEVWGIMADHSTIESIYLQLNDCLMLVREHLVH